MIMFLFWEIRYAKDINKTNDVGGDDKQVVFFHGSKWFVYKYIAKSTILYFKTLLFPFDFKFS